MLLLSPVFLAAALAVKFSDGGPVLFRQTRVGLHGRPFSFPKFRSMIVDAEAGWDGLAEQNQHADARSFKMKRDPRVTAVGAVLRRLSIDETPQLWCVLKGDMSLVGPRPPMPRETARYTLEDRRRLDVKPGLTGLWQVSGRGDVAFPEQLRLDVQYIHSQSLRMDLALLLKTIPAVLLGRGAY
jgi:lipopolysaccharide/colanic/teichoic acid biosynthesis glycosyltransferase